MGAFTVVDGEVILKDTSGNRASVTVGNQLKVINETPVKLQGSTSGNVVEVDANKQLKVVNETPNKIKGGTSGNIAEVNATNQLQVINTTPNKIQGDTSGNVVEVTAAGAMKVDSSGSGASLIKIQDATSGDIAQVTSAGELKVVNPPPVAPSGTTPIRIVQKSTTSLSDFFTVITNTKTMVLQRVSGGCEPSASGSVIEIFYAPNGNTTGIQIIEDIYVQGSSGQKDLNQEFVGNGTSAILLRRRVFGGGAVEITGRWEGYEK